MRRIATWAFAGCISTLVFAVESVASELTAEKIIEKNISARGGTEAWRKIQTMIWVGRIESANAPAPSMPFVLELKRPNKSRFEIKAQNQTTVRMFDGTHGWKLRPTSSGRPELQAYTSEEVGFARDGLGIEMPFMNYEAKDIAVTLEGVDDIEGHKAYRLSIKAPSGASHHLWIDTKTFLVARSDRETHNSLGQSGTVSVFYRNYRTIEGLQIPLIIESGAGTTKATDKMVIDKVLLNQPLDDRTFAKPGVPVRRHKVLVDISPTQADPRLSPGLLKLNPLSAPSPGGAQ